MRAQEQEALETLNFFMEELENGDMANILEIMKLMRFGE